MVLAAGCFTVNDALCKWLTPDYPVGQIIALRSAGILLMLGAAALVSRSISRQLVMRNYKLHAIRAMLLAVFVVERYQDEVGDFIATTVAGWDPEVTASRVELAIGRDLQFIRINGTLVGGLTGLALYLISWFMR